MPSTDTSVVNLSALCKVFGIYRALDDIDLDISKGTILGLLGPNGAGKTTLINIVAGLLEPTYGTVRIFNQEIKKQARQIKQKIGLVPDKPFLFEQLKADEHLYYAGRIYGLLDDLVQSRSRELFELFDLASEKSRRVYEYSQGMKKKLAVMCALIHDPELILFDEPFQGLDPVFAKTVAEIITHLSHNGRTVIIASHNLSMVEKLCTQAGLINRGRLIHVGSIAEIALKFSSSSGSASVLESFYFGRLSSKKEQRMPSWI